jgi:hypothetical protein
LDRPDAVFSSEKGKYNPSQAFVFSSELRKPYGPDLMEKEAVLGDVIFLEQ